MIIGSVHWIVATGIALSIHLLGVWWLTISSAQLQVDSPGKAIVVALGHDARNGAQSPEIPEPVEDASIAAMMEPEPRRPDTAESPATPEPVRSVMAAGSTEPETVAPRNAAPSREEPAIAARTVPQSAPAATLSVDTAEAARPGPAEPAQTPETAVLAATESEVEPNESAPAVLADAVPVAEPSNAPAAVQRIRSPTAEPPEIEVSRVELRVATAAAVENIETARPGQTASSPALQAVAPDQSAVATARQPAPQVEQIFEPDVSKPTQPNTVDLQELQESSGGTGAMARYAGVLKGWLQRNMHYPRAARLAGQEGKVVVRFVIDRDGNVQSIVLESKSGFPLLDREATEMVERGDPFPAVPPEMPGQRLEVRVPVSFHVRDETLTREIPPIYLK